METLLRNATRRRSTIVGLSMCGPFLLLAAACGGGGGGGEAPPATPTPTPDTALVWGSGSWGANQWAASATGAELAQPTKTPPSTSIETLADELLR